MLWVVDGLERVLVADGGGADHPDDRHRTVLHGGDERWQVHLDRRLNDRVGRVEVPVGEVVPHPSHVSPWDLGLGGKPPRVDGFHCLADLDESHPNGVEHEAIAEAAPLEVGSDRLGCGEDVGQPFAVPPAHNGMASLRTCAPIRGFSVSAGTT